MQSFGDAVDGGPAGMTVAVDAVPGSNPFQGPGAHVGDSTSAVAQAWTAALHQTDSQLGLGFPGPPVAPGSAAAGGGAGDTYAAGTVLPVWQMQQPPPVSPSSMTRLPWQSASMFSHAKGGVSRGGGGGGGANGQQQPRAAAAPPSLWYKSSVFQHAMCILAVFLLSFVLLVAIKPGFTYTKPKNELEARKFSAARAAVVATGATALAVVIMLVVALVLSRKKPAVRDAL